MIAVDTSTLVAYLADASGKDVELLDTAFTHHEAHLPPVVVTELLSARNVPDRLVNLIRALPILAVTEGYWERAGELRRGLLRQGYKAALADTLICQSCLDHDAALLTRDRDFATFARLEGLKLA